MVWTPNGPLQRGERGYYDHNRNWWPETPLLPDEARTLPETVPDEVIRLHAPACQCAPCSRYPASTLRRLKGVTGRAHRPG